MKVPYISQMEARECGAASLAMVLAYYGHHAPLAEVREVCGVSRDGVTARDIVTAAAHYGLKAEGHRVAPDSLGRFRHPVILHWEMNHFVVLESWGTRRSCIVDPARGRRTIGTAELDRAFTGIVLDVEPGPAFARRRRERPSVGLLFETLAGAPGALVMLILSALVINILGLGLPVAIQLIVDKVLPEGRQSWLAVIGWTLVGLVALKTVFTGLRARLDLLFNARFEAVLSERFVRHLLRLPLPFFEQRSLADLVGRVQSIAVVRGLLAGGAVGLVSDGLMLISAFVLMLLYDVRLALVVAGAGVLYLAIFLGTRPHQLRLLQTVQTEQIKQSTELVQILYGLPTLKASGSEAFRQNRWTSLLVNELNARHPTFSDSVGVALSVVRVITPAIVLLWGATLVLAGEITMGVLIGFQFLQGAFLQSLAAVFGILLRAQSLPVQIERMADVLGARPEPTGGRACPLLEGNITAEHVTFSYSRRGRPALDDVSFTIESGQKVAIVGPSGSGKSTLARVLLGLQEPKQGRVLFDGLPLADLDRASVRRQMGVVLQETTLFAGTIRENLSLSHPHAPLDEVIKAARAARIHDHIQRLPDGYDTPVSATRGALSGGQRQRLALARAILHRPPIMLLDEATSALDPLTEEAIEAYLSRRRCTRIVIAHRLTTVRNADLILVLDEGRIVEQGRHHELVALGGVYADLVARGEGAAEAPLRTAPAVQAGAAVSAADLAPFAMFARVGPDDLEALAGGCQRRVVAASTRVLEPGGHGPGLMLIESGTFSVVLEEPGLPSFEVAEVGPGEPLGETGLIDGAPGTAAVVAKTDCRFLLLPAGYVADLRAAADPLATKLTLGAGAVVAWRLRSVLSRQASMTTESGILASAAESAAPPVEAVALADTAFGAAFSAPELAALEAMGETRVYRRGAVIVEAGDPGHAVYVVLGGTVRVTDAAGAEEVIPPGRVFGELAFLDELPSGQTAVAGGGATCFVIPYDRLAAALESPGRVLQIAITNMALSAIRDLRRANLRLRELVATARGEREQALELRERAFAAGGGHAVAAERPASRGRVPHVEAPDAEHSAAACVAAVLRQQGRALPVTRVQEACARDAEMTAGAMQAAASAFGLTCRQLTIGADDLRFAREPLILESRAGTYVVADSDRRGRTQVMDPLAPAPGPLPGDFDETYTGRCFELRPDTLTAPSVAARVRRFASSRRPWLAQVVLTVVVLQVVAIGTPLISGFVIDQVIVAGDVSRLTLAAIAFAAVIALSAVHSAVKAAIMRFLRTQFDRELLDQLMGHMLRLPLRFFDVNDAGGLLQRFQTFRAVRALLGGDPPVIVLELLVLNISALVLILLQPGLAWLVIGVGAVSFLIGGICLRPLHRLVEQELDADAEQQDRLIELMRGVATLRVSGHQDGGASRWIPFLVRKLESRFRQEQLAVLEYSAIDGLRVMVLAVLIWSGAARVLDGAMSIGAFVAFYGIAGTMLGALASTASKLVPAAHVAVHFGRIRGVFEAEPEQDRAAARAPGKLRGRVAFEDVSFTYDGATTPVIDGVSFEIEPGMKVAIVGSSGAGKTTFARLLLGFYRPSAGRVLYDGRDLWGLDLTAVRRQLGVVLQDTYLFSGSIRQNVALGAPDATVDEVWDAVRLAGIEKEVRALPMHLETFVAEAGGAFSGGQRQRLAIARALIRKPPIVLFDEATSALDNVSQSVVEHGLAGLACTRIVVAHRLSTVVDADRILVLDAGRIVEQGTHAELAALGGHYARLMRPQMADVVR